MVMRNRHDGNSMPQWWEDLPPRIRERFSNPPTNNEDHTRTTPDPGPLVSRREIVGDLSRLVLVLGFAAVAVANMLFLLVALSFVTGR
ncbi:MAG: hypothetical protein L0241_19735 [Planctomycetia bacterium]|nr:hypothetical protein [Planctomycetia bacterium]